MIDRRPYPVSGAWRPGDDPGRRRFLDDRRRPSVRARGRRAADRRRHRLRDVGRARRHGLQRRPRLPRPHRRQPRGRAGRTRPPDAGLVGRRHRAGAAARHRPLLRRVRQRPRRLPGHDRPGVARPGRPAGRTARASRSCRSATWSARRPRWPTTSASTAGSRVRRRLDGRHAGARVGRHVPGPGALARRRSPPARRPRAQQIALVGDRAPGHRARPELARRRLLRRRARRRPARGPRARPHDRPRSRSAPTTCSPTASAARWSSRSTDRFALWQRFEVERYLDYHGDKLVRRFDANSYLRAHQGDGPARRRPRPRRRRAPRWRASRVPVLAIGITSATCSTRPTSSARSATLLARRRRRRPSTSRSTARTATTRS